jgi:glutathione S-transferase
VPAVEEAAKWEFGRACRVLEKGLGEKAFIVGDHFTAADIMFAQTIAWASPTEVQVESALLQSYADRLLARPALDRAMKRETAAAA